MPIKGGTMVRHSFGSPGHCFLPSNAPPRRRDRSLEY